MSQLDFCFKIENISCGGCKEKLMGIVGEAIRLKQPSVQILQADLDMETKLLTLTVNTLHEPAKVFSSLKLWLETEVLSNTKFKINADHVGKQLANQIAALLGLTFGLFWVAVSLGMLTLAPWVNMTLILAHSGVLGWIAEPFLQNAWSQLRLAWQTSGKQAWFNMDSLFALTGLIVIAVSLASLFFPVFSCMLEAGFLIFGFRHLGIIFQHFLDKKLDFSKPLVSIFKDKLYLLGNETGKKLARDFKVGEHMLCQQGDVIPVDGTILSHSNGLSLADNLKNGKYYEVASVNSGQKVLAGTLVGAGQLVLKVDAPIEQSRFSFIDASVAKVRSGLAPPILDETQTWLQWFIPGLLVLSVISGLLVAQWFSLTLAIQCAVSTLVSACPCTLGLIIPMALRMGAYKASLQHAVFKSSLALQQAAHTDIVVLDYNGTLTKGTPHIKNLQHFSEPIKVYPILYAIEQKMLEKRGGQLIGLAILNEISNQMKIQQIEPVDFQDAQFEDLNFGASLQTKEGRYWFGNNQMLKHLQVQSAGVENRYYLLFQDGDQSCTILAQLDIEDELRDDALGFIDALKQKNKKIVVCTGADEQTAEKISRELSIEANMIRANCSLADKAREIEQLRKQFPNQIFAMLGDGINDKAALEASDLRIWMKNSQLPGDFQISDSANLEIHSEQLLSLIQAFDISEQTFNLIYQNLGFSLVYNFLVLSVACGGLLTAGWSLHPAIGVSLMILQSALLVLNTYRALLTPIQSSDNLPDTLERRIPIATS